METVIRIAVIYLMIMVGLRLLGKREFGQLSPLELVTLLLIPEIASQALVREDFSVTNAAIGLFTLFGLVFATSLVTARFERAEKVIESTPTVLAHNGKIFKENLMEERVGPDEIYSQLRKVGLEELSQVKWAILEGDGKISIVPKNSGAGTPAKKRESEFVA